MISAVAVALALAAVAPVQQAAGDVQVRVGVERDTVTIGQPFRYVIEVRAPEGASIAFPEGPDTTVTEVELLDSRQVVVVPDTGAVHQIARYRLAAWDTGLQPLPMGEVVVRVNGTERVFPIAEREVFVASVLPEDPQLRVPKPARALFLLAPPWWYLWLLAAVAAAIIGLLGWWWWRRRRDRGQPVEVVDPYERAEREFKRLESLGLIEAGERGRYVALAVEIVRDYLAARVPAAPPSLTSRELLLALRGHPDVPAERLARLLGEADLIKFARLQVTPEHARELGREARVVVRDTEQARTAARPAEAA